MHVYWKIAIVLAVAGGIAGTLVLKAQDAEDAVASTGELAPMSAPAGDAAGAMQSDGAEAPAKPLARLVDLGADKCIPCKAMAPILAELKTEYADTFEVLFIDVWKNPDAGKEYGIQMIPTQIFYDAEGKERARHTGFMGKEDILAQFKKIGVI